MDQIYDVAVIGGGPSGIAAAFYAAKSGASTVLLEKDSVIGGTAYRANVNTLNGESLSGMDGLLDGITKKAWGHIIFDPEELLDRYYSMLESSSAKVLSGCEVISAESIGGRVTNLVCSGAAGKISISAKIIIDASGLSAVESLLGIKDGAAYSLSYITALVGKVETVGGKCYSHQAQELLAESVATAKETGKIDRNIFISIRPTVRADIAHVTIRYTGGDATGIDMRRHLNHAMDFLREFGYGFENASVISSSKEIFSSVSASFSAKYSLSLNDIEENKYFSDQVAAIPDGDGEGDPVYYIPYGSLQSKSYDNLLFCGRNIGAAANALQRIDSIATHFETGKAAGIAAGIAIKNDMELAKVSPYEIVSKSEDSISDKIEVMNEALEANESHHSESELQEEILSELKSSKDTAYPKTPEKEKTNAESFTELEHILELLGDDTPPPADTDPAEASRFKDIMDIELPDEKPEQSQPETEPKHAAKSELESLFDSLGDFADIAHKEDDATQRDEPRHTAQDIGDSSKQAPPVQPEEQADKMEPDDVLSLLNELSRSTSDNVSEKAPKSEPAPPKEDISFMDATSEKPNEPEVFPEQVPDETDDIRDTQTQEEKNHDAPSSLEDGLNGVFIEKSETASTDESAPEVRKDSPSAQVKPKKSIISSDNVLDMLYDEPGEKETRAVSGLGANMLKDDLSVLYDDEPASKPEEPTPAPKAQEAKPQSVFEPSADLTPEPAHEPKPLDESKKEPEPGSPKEHKNEMDSMLDMIYEISDSKEQSDELEHEIPPPGQKNKKTINGRISGKIENYDKFKAIKDFLYDED
jgi:hypothetical protein